MVNVHNIDFRRRSTVTILDKETGEPLFDLLCYGKTASDLATVDMGAGENQSGGAQVMRRLAARGIDTDKLMPLLWSVEDVTDTFHSKDVRKPEDKFDARDFE